MHSAKWDKLKQQNFMFSIWWIYSVIWKYIEIFTKIVPRHKLKVELALENLFNSEYKILLFLRQWSQKSDLKSLNRALLFAIDNIGAVHLRPLWTTIRQVTQTCRSRLYKLSWIQDGPLIQTCLYTERGQVFSVDQLSDIVIRVNNCQMLISVNFILGVQYHLSFVYLKISHIMELNIFQQSMHIKDASISKLHLLVINSKQLSTSSITGRNT